MTTSISGTDGVTFNDATTQNTSAFYGGLAMRNRIINGAMVIDQRNAGASVTPTTSGYGSCDRWQSVVTQTSKYSLQQNAGAIAPPVGFTNYLGVTSLSAYSVLTGDAFALAQKIEGFNTADLAWGTASAATATLSLWVRSSLTGTFGGALQNSDGTRNYPFTYTISIANTWEQKSITIVGDTTGTWNKLNSSGIGINFGLGAGATYSGTAGAWTGTNAYSTTGATSVVGTNGATFYITGVQLEKGSTATSFDYRPYGTELVLCQRYFEKSFDVGTAPANGGATSFSTNTGLIGGTPFNGGYPSASFLFKVQKRAAPTITSFGNSSGYWVQGSNGVFSANNVAFNNVSEYSFGITQQVVSATATAVIGHFSASAEL